MIQTITAILIVLVAAATVGKWIFSFFRSMIKPGKGGCGGSCSCGHGKEEKKSAAPKTVFIPVSALTRK